MKTLILAGGVGSRLAEKNSMPPKPMVEIGGRPILWHIMKTYSLYGFNDFVILCGYKGNMIKDYFVNYYSRMADITVDLAANSITHHNGISEAWKVTLIDTGLNTMTGGRIKRAKEYIGGETFMLTYGDGVGNIEIKKLLAFHKKHGKLTTMTAVLPEGRFGALHIDEGDTIRSFKEKPRGDGSWINGGYFVCEPEVLDYIEGDETVFEKEPLEQLAKNKELYAYKHKGFFKPMDTPRDKNQLEELIKRNTAPWIKW